MWTRIGDPDGQFVICGGELYRLTPNMQGVWQYSGSGTSWDQIGGPADSLIGGADQLYATQPVSGNIFRHDGGWNWSPVGGPRYAFAGCGRGDTSRLYGLSQDGQQVLQYSGQGQDWYPVGTAADGLIGGGEYLYALQPGTGNIFRYFGDWEMVAGPGAAFAACSTLLGVLSPDCQQVWSWTGINNRLQLIGDAADAIAVTERGIFTLSPGKSTVQTLRFSPLPPEGPLSDPAGPQYAR